MQQEAKRIKLIRDAQVQGEKKAISLVTWEVRFLLKIVTIR